MLLRNLFGWHLTFSITRSVGALFYDFFTVNTNNNITTSITVNITKNSKMLIYHYILYSEP